MEDSKKQFNSINASSLFHFTKKFDTLKKIISDGLRFSYAYESMPSQITANINYPSFPECVDGIYKDAGVAIPMISFCDIPITRAALHMGKYGNYMIGFDKAFMIDRYEPIINPVLYVHSRNLNDAIVELSNVYAETVRQQNTHILSLSKNGEGPQSKELQNLAITYGLRKFFLRYILGLVKPMFNPEKNYCYYNEREWRAFLSDNSCNNCDWIWEITEEDFKKKRDEWNENLSHDFDNYITLYEDSFCDGLTSIVVNTENEVNEIIEYIMSSTKLFGYSGASKKNRQYLISKITSFERIALDY